MEFQKRSMRFNVMEGNLMVAQTTAAYGFDVVDLHYWMTHQIHKRMPDGIHWTQDAVRLQLNIILTHFCLSRKLPLPGRWGGSRNRPLESAERIAKAADEGPVEIVKEDGQKRKGREDDEPPAKKYRVEESNVRDRDDNIKYSRHERERSSRESDKYYEEEGYEHKRSRESDKYYDEEGYEHERTSRDSDKYDEGFEHGRRSLNTDKCEEGYNQERRRDQDERMSAKEKRQQRWSGL